MKRKKTEVKSEFKTMDCAICNKIMAIGTFTTIKTPNTEQNFCEKCYEQNFAPIINDKINTGRKAKDEEEEKRIRWRNAPSKCQWVVKTHYELAPNASKYIHEIPFNIKDVELTGIKKGDILVVNKYLETDDIIQLYKVLRINKKTVSVRECNQHGGSLYNPDDYRNKQYEMIDIYSGKKWKIIE